MKLRSFPVGLEHVMLILLATQWGPKGNIYYIFQFVIIYNKKNCNIYIFLINEKCFKMKGFHRQANACFQIILYRSMLSLMRFTLKFSKDIFASSLCPRTPCILQHLTSPFHSLLTPLLPPPSFNHPSSADNFPLSMPPCSIYSSYSQSNLAPINKHLYAIPQHIQLSHLAILAIEFDQSF